MRPTSLRRFGLLAVLAAATGCAHMPFKSHETSSSEVLVGGKDSALTVSALQAESLRFADGYVDSVSHTADSVAKKIGTRHAVVRALNWKVEQATAAYADATGENPIWNALDLAVLAAVSRMLVDEPKLHEEFGDAVSALQETHRQLEKNAWALVGGFLTPEQITELQNLIVEWRRQNPGERGTAGLRFSELSIGRAPTAAQVKPTSIFSMLYINPLAGLNPTTVAIEQSRELAARVVAYAERAPTLMRWQAELLALQVSQQPESQQVLEDVSRASKSMESISKTAEVLPDLVDTQRKEAIDQFFAGVSAERAAILAELEAKEATIQTLLGQLREAMNAGGAMGESLTTTIKSLDAFVHYVSPPPSATAASAPPGKPFNVLDYGQTASQVGGMARDLSGLLHTVDGTAPALGKLAQQTGDDLKRVVDHAFWRGLILILVILVGSVPTRLAYRALAKKILGESGTGATRA
jgi:hypothetical protein